MERPTLLLSGDLVLRRAQALRREHDIPLQTSLTLAHMAEQLLRYLHQGETRFGYIKQDGSRRHARGTLVGYTYSFRRPYTPRPDNQFIVYYDLDAQGWRTCRIVSLRYVKPPPYLSERDETPAPGCTTPTGSLYHE